MYRHSHTGTKRLVEEYIAASLETIDRLLSTPKTPQSPSDTQILESLVQTRQAYGQTALLLSGGATMGMSHVGVVKALWEARLMPRIISGASAGSIVASVICSKTDDEIPDILRAFSDGTLVFEFFYDTDKPDGLLDHIARFIKMGAWVDIKHLTKFMKTLLGDMTFQEAYNRTRRALNICVSSEK